MGLQFRNVDGVTTITDDIQRLSNIGNGVNPYDAVNLSQLMTIVGALTVSETFDTVALQAAYTVPAGMTIVGVLMSGSVVGSNAYTYSGTTFTFSQAPDDIYPVTILYK